MARGRDDDDAPLLVQLARIRWRLDALDEWRAAVERTLGQMDERLQGIVKADELASAVADKIKEERAIGLTLVQKLCVFVVGAVAVAGGIKGLL